MGSPGVLTFRATTVLLSASLLLSASAFSEPASEPTSEPENAAPANSPEPCVIDTARASPRIRATYTPQAWATRNDLFLRACHESNGAFIDVNDPTLGKRLVRPDGVTADHSDDHYPPAANRAHESGWIDVIFIVEIDGTVSNITPVQGAEVFLEAAVAVAKTAKYRSPAYLDGMPIRSLAYWRLTFQ
jgi:outer membrane biosynthesis protein TonB